LNNFSSDKEDVHEDPEESLTNKVAKQIEEYKNEKGIPSMGVIGCV